MEQVQLHSTIVRIEKKTDAQHPAYSPNSQFVETLKEDDLAQAIWKAIIKPVSVEKMIRDVMQQFNVSETDLQPHVFAYLHDLQNQNMIKVINTNETAEQTEPLEQDRENITLKEL